MTSVFGNHQLGIPYQPVADLLAKYSARDPDKTAIVDLDGGSRIAFGDLDRVTTDIAAELKRRGVGKGDRVLLLSDENLREAADLARHLAHRRGDLPDQHRDQPEAHGRSGGRAQARRDPPPQGDRRCRHGRRQSGAAHQVRQMVAGRRARPAGRVLRQAVARPRRQRTARAQPGRRYRLRVLHLGHDRQAQDRDLRSRRLLAQRPRYAGISRPHRGRPHARISLVRLELGAGPEPAAVPAEGPDDAHRQALLAQPVLRLDPRQRHHILGRRADRAQHAAQQAGRSEADAVAAADELLAPRR